MGAALLMANLQALFRSKAAEGVTDPAELLRLVNRLFYEATSPAHFATVFFGLYDDADRTLRYVNCGHPAPILLRSNGGVERLAPTATVLGVFRNWQCRSGMVTLAPGDDLILFSDGVLEAGVDQGPEFGEERLLSTLRRPRTLLEKLDAVVADVLAFSPQQFDDITLAGLRACA